MSEPLAIELFRKFSEGASIEALEAAEGIPARRIEHRLRVAFGLILRANGMTSASAIAQGPWGQSSTPRLAA